MPGMGTANRAKGLLGTVHEIGPSSPMDMQIHKTGSQVAALQIHLHRGRIRDRAGRGADRQDAPCLHLHLAGAQHAILKKDSSTLKDEFAHEERLVRENSQEMARLSIKAQRTQRAASPPCVLCTIRTGCTFRLMAEQELLGINQRPLHILPGLALL